MIRSQRDAGDITTVSAFLFAQPERLHNETDTAAGRQTLGIRPAQPSRPIQPRLHHPHVPWWIAFWWRKELHWKFGDTQKKKAIAKSAGQGVYQGADYIIGRSLGAESPRAGILFSPASLDTVQPGSSLGPGNEASQQ